MATITVELLNDFAKKFATKCKEIFAKKTDIPTSLPANGGNADTVSGHTVGADVPANAKFSDTTYTTFVKSGSGAKAGLVPDPGTTAGTTKYLREDGTWAVPPDTNTAYSDMTAATSTVAGKAGLVPAPAAGKQNAFLRGDGTWQEIQEASEEDIEAIITNAFEE